MIRTTFFSILACGALLLANEGTAQSFAAEDSNTPQYGMPFAHVPAREDAIIYQVNMRAFSKEGNFAGVTARLDSIKALGVNVIYLMPIYPVGSYNSVNSPYCLRDYGTINKEFGTLSDLRTLVDGAHSLNMSVMLDWVGNHTSWDHPWLKAHREWYKTDSITDNVVPPIADWRDVVQLNFNNADMRLAMIAHMKYWVYAANIDGFRCDYADGPPADFWKQAIDTLRGIKTHKLLFLAEGTRKENYAAGFDYNFGFRFFEDMESVYKKNSTVLLIDTLNTEDNAGTNDGRQIVRYTTNHDVNGSNGTPIHLFGGERGSMGAFVIAAYMEGVPMIYNGQEVNMQHNIPFPFTTVKIDWTVNHDATEAYKKIIAFRSSSNAVKRGVLKSYSTDDICAFTKTSGSETVLVLANVRSKKKHCKLLGNLAANNWTNVMTGEKMKLKSSVKLGAYEYLILRQSKN